MEKAMEKASEKLQKLFEKSIEELELYMDGKKAGSDKTSKAIAIIGHYRGLKSQENNERATQTAQGRFYYSVVKDFAKDKGELKKHMQKMLPNIKEIK